MLLFEIFAIFFEKKIRYNLINAQFPGLLCTVAYVSTEINRSFARSYYIIITVWREGLT
jgi:hypothetical protein